MFSSVQQQTIQNGAQVVQPRRPTVTRFSMASSASHVTALHSAAVSTETSTRHYIERLLTLSAPLEQTLSDPYQVNRLGLIERDAPMALFRADRRGPNDILADGFGAPEDFAATTPQMPNDAALATRRSLPAVTAEDGHVNQPRYVYLIHSDGLFGASLLDNLRNMPTALEARCSDTSRDGTPGPEVDSDVVLLADYFSPQRILLVDTNDSDERVLRRIASPTEISDLLSRAPAFYQEWIPRMPSDSAGANANAPGGHTGIRDAFYQRQVQGHVDTATRRIGLQPNSAGLATTYFRSSMVERILDLAHAAFPEHLHLSGEALHIAVEHLTGLIRQGGHHSLPQLRSVVQAVRLAANHEAHPYSYRITRAANSVDAILIEAGARIADVRRSRAAISGARDRPLVTPAQQETARLNQLRRAAERVAKKAQFYKNAAGWAALSFAQGAVSEARLQIRRDADTARADADQAQDRRYADQAIRASKAKARTESLMSATAFISAVASSSGNTAGSLMAREDFALVETQPQPLPNPQQPPSDNTGAIDAGHRLAAPLQGKAARQPPVPAAVDKTPPHTTPPVADLPTPTPAAAAPARLGVGRSWDPADAPPAPPIQWHQPSWRPAVNTPVQMVTLADYPEPAEPAPVQTWPIGRSIVNGVSLTIVADIAPELRRLPPD